MSAAAFRVQLIDLEPAPADIAAEAIAGLRSEPKTLPCKLFYDKRGSELFEAICDLPEYYPTRTEIGIMQANLDEIAGEIGSRIQLIELGSGSSSKTEILLDALEDPVAYAPIDISREHLLESAERLHRSYPGLEVQAVCADYTERIEIPCPQTAPDRRVVFFPGSTIGNFHASAARLFLDRIADIAGPGGGLLIGVDLRKDPDELVAAYDDAQGVTAEFNLNLLHRLNREANADFDVELFEHRSVWNESFGRIEMHLVSRIEQRAAIDGHDFEFSENESIRTECAYKYEIEQFEAVAERFRTRAVWTDEDRRFSVQYLVVEDDGRERRNAVPGAGPEVI